MDDYDYRRLKRIRALKRSMVLWAIIAIALTIILVALIGSHGLNTIRSWLFIAAYLCIVGFIAITLGEKWAEIKRRK